MKPVAWNDLYRNGVDYAPLDTQTITQLTEHNRSSRMRRALDIGCGTGQLCRELYHRGYDTTGIDPSSEAIEIARKSSVYTDISLTFLNSTIEDFSGIHHSFDLVSMKAVLAFIDDKPGALKIVHQLLASDGQFVLCTPHPKYVPVHKQHITIPRDMLETLLNVEFSIGDVQETGKYIIYRCQPN